MNAISFKATKIDTVKVRERQVNGRYKDQDFALLKLGHSKADIDVLSDLSSKWDKRLTFAGSIYADYINEDNEEKTIYLISAQEKFLRKLNIDDILGIAEVTKNKNSYKINYIQTRPDCMHGEKKRPFKKIGEELINSIINLTGNFKIYLKSLSDLVDYYKRFGFEVVQNDVQEPLMVLIKKTKKL